MMRNPLIHLVFNLAFGLIFLLFILPLGYLIRRNDPLQLRRRANGSYLRMLDHDSASTVMPGTSAPIRKTDSIGFGVGK
ncbi:hypothetical protein [Verminephrobacter eiseniae]|uniref:hypothetical protein n=1 Tax=Verminephrobacter eiseniae TaxID=364317 RepID=UPI002237C356|nr:hypothetical protein [Verminephrobacter eiseniae]MCW5236649.1 hypothetical protein [Verminephrobacter eiseniae]